MVLALTVVCSISATFAWIAFAMVGSAGHTLAREAAGWIATTLSTLAVLPAVSLMVGPALFLLAADEDSSLNGSVLAVVVTVIAVGASFVVYRRRDVRYFAIPILVLGLGVAWLGRYVVTVDWLPSPS